VPTAVLIVRAKSVRDALLALAFRAMYLWLRPLAQRVRQTPPDRRHAERLVREHGTDSLAFFALRRDREGM